MCFLCVRDIDLGPIRATSCQKTINLTMIDSYAAVAVEEEGRLRRRRAVASLLVFANELERTQRISKASKGLLKELIVNQNEEVMSVGEALASAAASQVADQQLRALEILEQQIKHRASKSHEELFEICPLEEAHLLSQEDTKLLLEGSDTKSLVYGEIDFWSFYDVVRAAVEGIDVDVDGGESGPSIDEQVTGAPATTENQDELPAGVRGSKGLKFYDLGSGSGKAIFAAVLAVDFRCAVGIEVLARVHEASMRVLRRYRRLVEPVLSSPALIKLYHGSFLAPEFDWTDGDLIFANSTCFAEDTLLAISAKAIALKPGARVVTFTTALRTAWLRVLLKRRYLMSWGPATVFVHQKLSQEEYVKRISESTPYDQDQGLTPPKVGAEAPGTAVMAPCPPPSGILSIDNVVEHQDNACGHDGDVGCCKGGGRVIGCYGGGNGRETADSEKDWMNERGPVLSASQRPLHC